MRKSAPRTIAIAASALVASVAAAADFVVTNTNPSGPGSLYQAITDANNLRGADRILFNIPGAGVHTIDAGQARLPTVVESLVIDGYSQPGAKPNSLQVGSDAVILIQIDGSSATTAGAGLEFTHQGFAADYVVRGLSVTGFATDKQQPYFPYFVDHSYGIVLVQASSAVIAGNFLGILPDGETARGNYGAVRAHPDTMIGGVDPTLRNVISGNTGSGVSGGGVIQGNYVGTNASGTRAVPNAKGIFLSRDYVGTPTIIGGTSPNSGNLISGNEEGISLGYSAIDDAYDPSVVKFHPAKNLPIKGNLIGLQADGISPLPNRYAIQIAYGSNNVIGGLEPGAGNLIAFNGFGVNAGYLQFPTRFGDEPRSEGNQVLSNAIYGNGGMAIDVGSNGFTPNDPRDEDIGPNLLQNSPVIQSAEVANGVVSITGNLNSTPETNFTLQYFSESTDLARPIQTYLGSGSVTTDANGNTHFSANFPVQDPNVAFNMTATSEAGNTSEFSRNAPRMLNVSTRLLVGSGERVAIAGFILNKSAIVVLRAIGPSLGGQLAGTLRDPLLELYDSTGKQIDANDNWSDYSGQSVEDYDLAPDNPFESALAKVLAAGSYTIVIRDRQNRPGIGLVELYKIEPLDGRYVNGDALNLSTRGFVEAGNNVMIAGTILQGINGSTRIVARALGPSLAAAGITHPLADPTLELHNAQGGLLASNDDWRNGEADALTALGFAPPAEREAAIFTRLTSGAYTAIVRGKGNTAGVALVELYNLH